MVNRLDPLWIYAEQVRALVAQDESPVAAVLCQQAFGSDRLERTPADWERVFGLLPGPVRERVLALTRAEGARRPPKGWERAAEKVLDALSGDLIGGDADLDGLIGGVSAAGHAGSCAARLAAALTAARGSTYCVVTGRRLILAEHGDPRFGELLSLPLTAVLGARRAGRFLQRGRVVIDFVDLSQVALMTGMLFTGAADRLVTAIRG